MSVEAPCVSVVIPVYGTEDYLAACLDSVLAQTLADIEVVCVNDCSPDGCAAILADYAARDSRVHVITLEKNSGQGIARNAGFKASSGRYAYFLDSDDMVVPQALEELVARADADQLDGVFFDSKVVYDSPEYAKRYKSYPACHTGVYEDGVMRGADLFAAYVAQYDWTCYVQRQLWRSSYLRERGITFQRFSPHEDETFAFEALVQAERVVYLPEPYFIRRYRPGSAMTSKMGLRNFTSYFQSLDLMLRIAHGLGLNNRETRSNIGRIFFACKRLYEQLKREGIDPGTLLYDDPTLLDGYLVFSSSQDFFLHYGLLSASVESLISQYERLFIYGAGAIASDVFDVLAGRGFAIEGFIVTSKAKNPDAFKGHHVYELSQISCDCDALVIVAVTDGYRADIELALDEAGWQHVYYKEQAGKAHQPGLARLGEGVL